jgi:hypothetical protein
MPAFSLRPMEPASALPGAMPGGSDDNPGTGTRPRLSEARSGRALFARFSRRIVLCSSFLQMENAFV